MRNLKKVLSLALALVMLLGMMVVGAGATSFKDDSSIPENRAVAVAVANALEVLLGDENGNFNPDNTLTRAEAAVVLTKLDLGADAAKALTATNAASFDDVGTGYGWAKAYIDYCAGNGYMVGVGGNRFAPGRTLTSVEFATMVSRVLGYKDENEYGKDGWTAVKAAALARKAGLGADVVVANADMTRADMAQMVFNALTAPMVEYTGLNGSIGDATFNSPATTRKHANDTGRGDTDYKGDLIQPNITPIRLCEERFPYLKLSTTAEDSFGHTASVWKNRNVEIKGSETTVEADVTITGKVLKTLPDWAKIKGLRTNTKSELFINGDTSTALPADMDKFASNLTDNGRLVEIYLNEADLTLIDKVVITDTALAEVTKVVDSNESISVKLAKSDVTTSSVVLNTKEGYGEFKKGDLVLVQGYSTANPKLNAKTTVTSVAAPTVVSGFATIKKYDDSLNALYIKIDGEDYYDAKGVMEDYSIDKFNLNTEFDSELYLDQYGYIMKAIQGKDPKAVTDNVIAVERVYQTLTNNEIVTMVRGVLSNGETVNWVAKAATGSTLTVGQNPEIMTWAKGTNGVYELSDIADKGSIAKDDTKTTYVADATTTGEVTFKTSDVFGKQTEGRGYMFSDTVKFIFVDTSEGVTVVNGRQNYVLPSGRTLVQAVKGNDIIAVFVTGAADVADVSDIIYVDSRNREWDEIITNKDGKNIQYYGYTAYDAKGEKIEPFLGVDPNMTKSFIVKDVNEDGAYKNTTKALLSSHTMVKGEVQKANGRTGDAFTMKVNNKTYEFIGNSSTNVKDLTDTNRFIDSIPELNSVVNDGNSVEVAVIYNNTEADSTNPSVTGKVKQAITVYVTSITPNKGTSDVPAEVGVSYVAILNNDDQEVTFVVSGTTASKLTIPQKLAAIKSAYAKQNKVNADTIEVTVSTLGVGMFEVTDKATGGMIGIYSEQTGVQLPSVPNEAKAIELGGPKGTFADPSNPTTDEMADRAAYDLINGTYGDFVSFDATFTPTGTNEAGDKNTVEIANISWNSNLNAKVPFFFYDPDIDEDVMGDDAITGHGGNNYSIKQAYLTLTLKADGTVAGPSDTAAKSVANHAGVMPTELNEKGITHFAIIPIVKTDGTSLGVNIIFKNASNGKVYWQNGTEVPAGGLELTRYGGALVTFK